MADFNFPSNPLLYDTHTEGDTIYEWDGVAWNVVGPDFVQTTVEINSTRTLSPGVPASVFNIGTPTNVLLNFSIPQGIQGEQGWPGPAGGPPGPEGPPGPPGSGAPGSPESTRIPGEVIAYAGNIIPVGWLECNGQSTAGHPVLAAVVGSNVPDLRGEFVRGWDNGKGTDSGRTLGSSQGSVYGSHDHGVTDPGHFHGIPSLTSSGSAFGCTIAGPSSIVLASQNSGTNPTGILVDYSGSTENNSETRPRNVALMYIIKT